MAKRPSSSHTVINPLGIVTHKEDILFFYRRGKTARSRLLLRTSTDGRRFSKQEQTVRFSPLNKGELEGVNSPPILGGARGGTTAARITEDKNHLFMAYLANVKRKPQLTIAQSRNATDWKIIGQTDAITEPAALVDNTRYQDQHIAYFGDTFIEIGFTKNFRRWQLAKGLLLTPREAFFDCAPLRVLGAHTTAHGLLVTYDASYAHANQTVVQIGAAVFSADNPQEILWRSEVPLWQEIVTGEYAVRPIGSTVSRGALQVYWQLDTLGLLGISLQHPLVAPAHQKSRRQATARSGASLDRHAQNPILEPRAEHSWEIGGTFNPAAVQTDDAVHLIYRAVGDSGVSVFGYAASEDGVNITYRSDKPVYLPRKAFEGALGQPGSLNADYQSGFGWGGCEDPKLTRIGDRIFMTYVAFNGWAPPRAAITSIAVDDFLAQNWQWDEPRLISPPHVVTKSACLLPELVQGQYIMFHRIFPDILIDKLDDLEFKKTRYLQGQHRIRIRSWSWDSRKLSVGATPLKTDDGWLVIYHAVDDRDANKYKIGAMLLDREDPTRVLYRTRQPLLEPETHYENDGKPGVVYPCGAAVIQNDLLVYYGGGDKVVCVAQAPLDRFIHALKKDKEKDVTLTPVLSL